MSLEFTFKNIDRVAGSNATLMFAGSVMSACCNFSFAITDNVASIDISRVLHLPATIQTIFNYHIQIMSFFVFPVNI